MRIIVPGVLVASGIIVEFLRKFPAFGKIRPFLTSGDLNFDLT